MIRLLRFLITGRWAYHEHYWVLLRKVAMEDEEVNPRPWLRFYCRCHRCGVIKHFE